MERISFRISTWEKGRQAAKELEKQLHVRYEERDSTIYLLNEDETIRISFFMDDRGFCYVLGKLNVQNPEEIIIKLKQYEKT